MTKIPYFRLFLVGFLLLSFAGSGCKTDNANRIYTGTIFLNSCNVVAIDIDGPAGTGKGVLWTTHANAATILNYCLIDNKNIAVGGRISFKISDTNVEPGSNCPVLYCIAATPCPNSYIYVYDVNMAN